MCQYTTTPMLHPIEARVIAVDAEDCFLQAYVHIVGLPFKKGWDLTVEFKVLCEPKYYWQYDTVTVGYIRTYINTYSFGLIYQKPQNKSDGLLIMFAIYLVPVLISTIYLLIILPHLINYKTGQPHISSDLSIYIPN